jgi:type III secretion protein N (ATPase)
MSVDIDMLRARLRAGVSAAPPSVSEGRVVSVRGFTVRATGLGARVGDVVRIERPSSPLRAEVVGFEDALAVLMPLGDLAGVGLDDAVRPTGERAAFACGEGVLGRVLDALGEPRDGGGALAGERVAWAVDRAPPDPLRRARVQAVMPLGVRAIDGLATVGAGQRVGVFAGAGAGKSALLAQAARNAAADVVVVGLVGERGREVRDFLEDALDAPTRRRACVVVATSDEAPVLRVRAAKVAMSVAEFFRERGAQVLLLLDSVTRVARAQREVGLAAGEPAVRRGFPPSVFAALPRLLERAGPGERGAITALCTVLVEGGDLDEPIADEVRGILDGHVVLDRSLGARCRWPAVDVPRSLSRVMDALVSPAHRAAAARVRAWVSALDAGRDLIAMGAYAPGRDATLDEALARRGALEAFLAQRADESSGFEETVERLLRL